MAGLLDKLVSGGFDPFGQSPAPAPPGPPLNLNPAAFGPGAVAPPVPISAPASGFPAPISGLATMLGRLSAGIADNPLTLMALGAGIAKGGIAGGLAAAAETGVRENALAHKTDARLLRALIAAGVPPAIALTLAQNPSLIRPALTQQPSR